MTPLLLLLLARPTPAVDFVVAGRPAAAIVTPDFSLPVVTYAAEELVYHLREASGAQVPVMRESEAPGQGPRLYLGSCRAAAAAGLDTGGLPPNGFRLKLVGEAFFLLGDDSDGPAAGVLHNNRTRVGTLFAVYEFLEQGLGVRWLWPGKLGEFIPQQPTVRVDAWDQTGAPAFTHARWRDGGPIVSDPQAWSSAEARNRFLEAQGQWLRRNRFSLGVNLDIHHAFTTWWAKHGEAHPEYFNQLPDGARRPDPAYYGGAAELVAMCVSEPAFHEAIVENWTRTRSPGEPYLDVSENDTPGKCTCKRCLAWDVPDPDVEGLWDERLARARADFEAGRADWWQALGSLSDRYARHYLAAQEAARRVDPEAVVLGFAYANYVAPPRETKLNDHIVVGIVPPLMFPWTEAKRQACRAQWEGWSATGAQLLLRPNYMLDGHCFPIFVARRLGEEFRFCAEHGMIGTDFDSLTGQYATQGPNHYMLARLHARPELTVDQVLDEYFAAFGPAEQPVRAYFAHWERITEAWVEDSEDLSYSWFDRGAHRLFTPGAMREGERLLEVASEAAQGNRRAEERVAFLADGLRNASLTLEAAAAWRGYREAGDIATLRAAVRRLDDHRRSAEDRFIANPSYLRWSEGYSWDRELLRLMPAPGERLVGPWRFAWDPQRQGEADGWAAEDFDDAAWAEIGTEGPWEQTPVGRQWEAEHGASYDGVAWYRTAFAAPADPARPGVRLVFGAVDEACSVWLNGTRLLERPYPHQGNPESWQEAFEVDIAAAVRYDRLNVLAVRVEDNSGAGGIWRPVWLLRSAAPAGADNLLPDGGFEEPGDAWKRSIMCGEFAYELDATQPRSGGRSGKLTCSALGAPEVEATMRTRVWGRWYTGAIAVDPARTYRLRLWAKTSRDFAGKLAIWVTGTTDGTTARNVLNTEGLWQEILVEGLRPTGDAVGVYLNLMDGTGTAWFDDVELITE
ncbi:MAG: DUF4838 domain-containing protein [Armatimonadetes bacterium]|nr:DUF4838 domain-containing protein [Armatimonadota bacterium]